MWHDLRHVTRSVDRRFCTVSVLSPRFCIELRHHDWLTVLAAAARADLDLRDSTDQQPTQPEAEDADMTKLRPRDVAALPRDTTDEQAAALLSRDYETFCACVVAEATRKVPKAFRRVLRQPDWHDDWIDALLGIEATLQIAVLRARYEDGPHADRTIRNSDALAGVRSRLHQVRARARHREHHHVQNVPVEKPAVRAATRGLTVAHRDEYHQLIDEALAAAGLPADVRRRPTGDCATMARWVLNLGVAVPAMPPPGGEVDRLVGLPDDAFDQVVARDVRRDPETPDLCHPLLLDRWGESLCRLAQSTATQLGLPERPMGAISDVDLTVAGLDSRAAYRRIKQLRFLAHVQQRWLEQKTLARRFRQTIVAWHAEVTGPPVMSARETLRRRYPEEFSTLLGTATSLDGGGEPAPSEVHEPSPAPQAARIFAERLEESGWAACLEYGQTKGGELRAWVEATRGSAKLRAAYRRKNKGRRSSRGWALTFVGAQLRGLGWVTLPKVADAIDLALMSEDVFAEHVARYAAMSASSGSDKARARWVFAAPVWARRVRVTPDAQPERPARTQREGAVSSAGHGHE